MSRYGSAPRAGLGVLRRATVASSTLGLAAVVTTGAFIAHISHDYAAANSTRVRTRTARCDS